MHYLARHQSKWGDYGLAGVDGTDFRRKAWIDDWLLSIKGGGQGKEVVRNKIKDATWPTRFPLRFALVKG